MKQTIRFVVSFVLSMIPLLIAIALSCAAVHPTGFWWLIPLGLLVAALVLNLRRNYQLNKNVTSGDVKQFRSDVFAAQELARKDPEKLRKSLNRTVLLAWLYVGLIVACCFVTVLLIPTTELAITVSVPLLFVLSGVFGVLIEQEPDEPPENPISPEDYPLLYDSVLRVMKDCGIDRPAQLHILEDDNIAVGSSRKTIHLLLGAVNVCLLTRRELEQVLMHEFAHVRNEDTAENERIVNIVRRWSNPGIHSVDILGNLLMRIPIDAVQTRCSIYQAVMSEGAEALADCYVVEHGDPKAYADALAKGAMWNFFVNEPCAARDYEMLSSPEPISHMNRQLLEIYHRQLALREEKWRGFLANELPPKLDSHPIARQRILRCVDDLSAVSVHTEETDPAYLRESQALLDASDKLCEASDREFLSQRLKDVEKRNEAMDRFRQSEAPYEQLDVGELYDAAGAFAGLDDDLALEICDHILEQEPHNEYAMALKGSILLLREDEDGVELLFEASRTSVNYVESYMDLLMDYASKHGNQELLDRCRNEGLELQFKILDRTVSVFSTDDRSTLSPNDLPEDTRQEVLEFILSHGRELLQEVLTIQVTVGDEHVYHYFLVYPQGTASEVAEELYGKVFRYLDMRTERFCLGDELFGSKKEKELKKWFPECVIWSRGPDNSAE